MLFMHPRELSSSSSPSLVYRWRKLIRVILVMSSLFFLLVFPHPGHALSDREPASEHSVLFDSAGSPPILDSSLLKGNSFESSYWIWVVLPRLFPEYLTGPGGYLSLGFAWRAGDEVPIGISKIQPTRFTQSSQRLDCLGCHQATSLKTSNLIPTPHDPVNVQSAFTHQAYESFLRRCAEDPRFDAEYLLPAIRYSLPLNWLAEQQYRYSLIPAARKSFLKHAT